MKTIVKVIVLSVALVWSASTAFAQSNASGKNGNVKISSVRLSPRGDTIFASFKLMRDGRKFFDPSLLKSAKTRFHVKEEESSEKHQPLVDTILDLRQGKQKSLSDDLSILLLIDRSGSISNDLLKKQKEVVESFIKSLQGPKLYISFMDNGMVTPTQFLDSTTFYNEFVTDFFPDSQNGEKHLYRAILSKLQELSGEDQTEDTYPTVATNTQFKDIEGEKMLFVFTDGQIADSKGNYYGGDANFTNCRFEYMMRESRIKNGELQNIPVHCVYVGSNTTINGDLLNSMKALCSTGKADDLKGKFYQTITPDSIQDMMMSTLDSLSADYQLVLVNPEGKMYDGSQITLLLEVLGGNGAVMASGSRIYSAGNLQSPIQVSYKDANPFTRFLTGLLIGVLLLALVYLVLQYIVPAIRYKQFLRKYVKPYSSSLSGSVAQSCYFCKEPFAEGDIVVTKCQHVVHKECWDENRNRCPEYGMHKCKQGIHYYNQEKKSDPRNATHYTPWILFGFGAGLLSWLGYTMLQASHLFSPMMESITRSLFPFTDAMKNDPDSVNQIVGMMADKTGGLLLCGLLLGFFITFAFSWVIDFRKKDAHVIFMQLLRSIVGAVCGFAAFLLGSLVVVLCGKYTNCWYVDWLPWLFFSLSIALVLWFKTEIKLSSALLGGAASIIFSFIVMFVLTGPITSLFSYMIYAAGFGMSVAVVHFTSEKYFLRINGSVKERDIAIYKWMSVTGGFNKVSIGKSVNCVLQMNWDATEGISDRAVELYLENDRPYCRVLDHGVTQQGRTVPKGTVLLLVNGTEFTIGKTRFTYIEKDR